MKNITTILLEASNEPLQLPNHLLTYDNDRRGRVQATARIFLDLCRLLRKQKNSPKDMIEDIKYLITDYLDTANPESYLL